MRRKMSAHDKLPGLACLARRPFVAEYHNIEAAMVYSDKPMQVASVDMFEVARSLVVEAALMVEGLVETLVVLFPPVVGHNILEDIERKGERSGIRGLQVEVGLEEFGTAKVFEEIAIGVCTVPSRMKRKIDLSIAEKLVPSRD